MILSEINNVPEFTFKVNSYCMAVIQLGNPNKYLRTFHKLIDSNDGETAIVVGDHRFTAPSIGEYDTLVVEILDEWSVVSEFHFGKSTFHLIKPPLLRT